MINAGELYEQSVHACLDPTANDSILSLAERKDRRANARTAARRRRERRQLTERLNEVRRGQRND